MYKDTTQIIVWLIIAQLVVTIGGFYFMNIKITNSHINTVKNECASFAVGTKDLGGNIADSDTLQQIYNQCVKQNEYGYMWSTINNIETDLDTIKEGLPSN